MTSRLQPTYLMYVLLGYRSESVLVLILVAVVVTPFKHISLHVSVVVLSANSRDDVTSVGYCNASFLQQGGMLQAIKDIFDRSKSTEFLCHLSEFVSDHGPTMCIL
ncbi:hypothetical protein BJ170DRAFT_662961 [Xylariales sp. AK1849]|nr:hypothetical protein BJ170DRAFT_662961 [Xylariales sp. AK1849]